MVHTFEHCRFCGGRGCAACPEEARKWEANGGAFPPSKIKPPPVSVKELVGNCHVCGEPARFLCDGPPIDDGNPNGDQAGTCDRPMCDHHIAYQSRIKLQKWAPGRGRYCEWTTYDLCRDCLERKQAEAERLKEKEHQP